MTYKRYEIITAGELRKMHGKKCRFETYAGLIIEDGIISVDEDGWVGISHDNEEVDGRKPENMFGKKYGRCIYGSTKGDDWFGNRNYNRIEVENADIEVDSSTTVNTEDSMGPVFEWVYNHEASKNISDEYHVGYGKVKKKRPGGPEVGQDLNLCLVKYSLGKYGLHVQRVQDGVTTSQSMIGVEPSDFISYG